jgi:hypothetical protein
MRVKGCENIGTIGTIGTAAAILSVERGSQRPRNSADAIGTGRH